MAQPMEAAIRRRGSLVLHLARTQKVIPPGVNSFSPWVRDMILQRGGKMLDTWTRLHFSIPASRRDNSKERSSSLCTPTPLVKKSLRGTKDSNSFLLCGERFFSLAKHRRENFSQKTVDQFGRQEVGSDQTRDGSEFDHVEPHHFLAPSHPGQE